MWEAQDVLPAVSSLEVVSVFGIETLEGLVIPVFEEGEAPRHLILTGPNGTGKSSILLGLSDALEGWPNTPASSLRLYEQNLSSIDTRMGDARLDDRDRSGLLGNRSGTEAVIGNLKKRPIVEPSIRGVIDGKSLVVAYVPANRRFTAQPVAGPKRVAWPEPRKKQQNFAQLLLQHLVNRRAEQAFARESGDERSANEIKHWFDEQKTWLREALDQPKLELLFDAKTFAFSLAVDDHIVPFDGLPDGFASILTLWSEILLRTAAVEGEPTGFVLIDEPELHLHPELQEELLPLLTKQFPSLQFIVATHSPIVATSLSNSTIYDLESRQPKRSEDLQGIRYGNVLKLHFGLRTDFDSATTAKLDRLFELRKLEHPTDAELVEQRELASELAEHGHLLALEVLKELPDD